VANFYLYADESGKFNRKSEYTSFCGFIAPDLEWWRFGQDWDHCRFSWGVPAVHMAEISDPDRKPDSEWAKVKKAWGITWEDRKRDMLMEFAKVIRMANLVCVGCTVDAEYYEKMPETDYKRGMGDPLYLAFYNLVRNAIDKLDWLHDKNTLSVVIDDDQQSSENYYNLLGQMRKRFSREINERISGLAFGNDVAFPGLQAADMIAYESRNLIRARKADKTTPPSQIYALMTKNGLHQPTLYTPEFLDLINKDNEKI
jgi:Protein of unknown function (DUF3800)